MKDIPGQATFMDPDRKPPPDPDRKPPWLINTPPCPPAKRRAFNLKKIDGKFVPHPDGEFIDVDWETGKPVQS